MMMPNCDVVRFHSSLPHGFVERVGIFRRYVKQAFMVWRWSPMPLVFTGRLKSKLITNGLCAFIYFGALAFVGVLLSLVWFEQIAVNVYPGWKLFFKAIELWSIIGNLLCQTPLGCFYWLEKCCIAEFRMSLSHSTNPFNIEHGVEETNVLILTWTVDLWAW